MKVWWLVVSCWFLVACTTPVQYATQIVEVPRSVLPAEVERLSAEWTATAEVMATTNAMSIATATAQYQQTQDAGNARATEFHFDETANAATQTVKETQFAFIITEAAVTASADLATSQAQRTATAQTVLAAQRAKDDDFYGGLTRVFWSAASLISLLSLLWIGRSLARRADKYSDPLNAVRVVRTGVGVLIVTRLRSGEMKRELYLNAPAAGESFDTDEQPADTEAPIAPGRKDFQTLNAIDEKNRAEVLTFLSKAIKINGDDSNSIPGYREMGLAPETWTARLKLIGDQVKTQRGRNGGTWLVGQHRSLKELWLAVGERRYSPRPPASETTVVQPSALVPVEADAHDYVNN